MANTKTLNVTKDAGLMAGGSTGYGNGKGTTMVAAYDGSNQLRMAMQFSLDWTDVSQIVSAVLHVRSGNTWGYNSPSLKISRFTGSWNEGSYNGGDTNFSYQSGAINYVTGCPATASDVSVTFTPGTTHNTWYTVDITTLVLKWAPVNLGGAGETNYGLLLTETTEGSSTNNWDARTRESGYGAYIVLTYNTFANADCASAVVSATKPKTNSVAGNNRSINCRYAQCIVRAPMVPPYVKMRAQPASATTSTGDAIPAGMMRLQITDAAGNVSDVISQTLLNSIHIRNTGWAQAGTMSFRLAWPTSAGVCAFTNENEVKLWNSTGIQFGGYIQSIKHSAFVKGESFIDITCRDYTCLLDRYVIPGYLVRSTVESDADRIAWLLTGTPIKTDGGFVQTLVAQMPTQEVSDKSYADILKMILSLSSADYYVDYNKQLHTFVASEGAAAPFGLSDAPDGSTNFGFRNLELPDETTAIVNGLYLYNDADLGQWYYDLTSVGLYGPFNRSIKDTSITDQDTLDRVAQGFLAENSMPARTGSLVTQQPGLQAGMIFGLTCADYSPLDAPGMAMVAEPYRITEISETFPSGTPSYSISFGVPKVTLQTFRGSGAGSSSSVGNSYGIVSNAGPDADTAVDVAGAAGSSATAFARSGHGHKLATYSSTPTACDATAASAGTAGTAPARGNHRHLGHAQSHNHSAAGDGTALAPASVAATGAISGASVAATGTVTGTNIAVGDVAWHTVGTGSEPAFANSWVNFGAADLARFRKDQLGYVHLAGFIKSGTVGSAAFTLPAGYRPPGTARFVSVSNAAFGQVVVASDGTVKPYTGSNVSFSLEGIVFLGEV